MKLVFFGRLRDEVGVHELEFCIPANVRDVEALRRQIGGEHPVLLDPGIRIAVDDVLVSDTTSIAGAGEIAFLPPVSGG